MNKPADVQMQQVADPEFWLDQARRSIDGVANLWKSTLEYHAEMAQQWKKLTLEIMNSQKK